MIEDEEEPESFDSQRTRRCTDEDSDLVLDEALWTQFTHGQKVCRNTGPFTVPRDIEDRPSSLHAVQSAEAHNDFSFFAHTRQHSKYDIESVRHGLTDDDQAMLRLYTECIQNVYRETGALKASTTQELIGKKRTEAAQQEFRAYTKQFLEAKQLRCKSWLGNEVFDPVDTRKLQVRNWVTGRRVLTIKRDKEGKLLKTKARWALRGFQDRQKTEQQTDSPAASRSGFRLAVQVAAKKGWSH